MIERLRSGLDKKIETAQTFKEHFIPPAICLFYKKLQISIHNAIYAIKVVYIPLGEGEGQENRFQFTFVFSTLAKCNKQILDIYLLNK